MLLLLGLLASVCLYCWKICVASGRHAFPVLLQPTKDTIVEKFFRPEDEEAAKPKLTETRKVRTTLTAKITDLLSMAIFFFSPIQIHLYFLVNRLRRQQLNHTRSLTYHYSSSLTWSTGISWFSLILCAAIKKAAFVHNRIFWNPDDCIY